MKRGINDIAALSEQRIQRMPIVFQAGIRIHYCKAHFCWLFLNTDLIEQPQEIWISSIIENNKAGINRIVIIMPADIMSMGMPTQMITRTISAG